MKLDILAARARLTPERPALHFRRRWYTYAELDERATRLAACLHERGIKDGDRVAILAHNHLAHFDLMAAAPRLGFVHAPFNTRLSAGELARMAEKIEPALMLHDHVSHGADMNAMGCPYRDLAHYDDWLATAPGTQPPSPSLTAESCYMLLFTGGSTGLPKAAMIPYRQVFYNAVNTVFSWGLTEDDCVIQATPAFHAAINVLATPLLQFGARVVLAETFAPGAYLEAVQKHGVTTLFLVPTMYRMLAEHPDFEHADLGSVRWAISGGAPCPAPVRDAFAAKGVAFKQGYGLTEAGVNCFAIGLDEARAKPEAVGRPMLHAEAVIRDADGRPVPDGEVGELTLAGEHVFTGYFRDAKETRAALRDGWLWTGDLARRDTDGCFHITGRRKEMFISGGENVFPAEIENALYRLPEIAECAVVGIADERWGEAGLAAVVFHDDSALDVETLRARLRRELAGYKVPAHYLFLDNLPKSGAGKILKPEIAKRFLHERS